MAGRCATDIGDTCRSQCMLGVVTLEGEHLAGAFKQDRPDWGGITGGSLRAGPLYGARNSLTRGLLGSWCECLGSQTLRSAIRLETPSNSACLPVTNEPGSHCWPCSALRLLVPPYCSIPSLSRVRGARGSCWCWRLACSHNEKRCRAIPWEPRHCCSLARAEKRWPKWPWCLVLFLR